MTIIPAIDLLEGHPVRLFRGDFKKVTKYQPNAVEIATEFEQAGAQWLHIVDLDAARGTGNNRLIIKDIRNAVKLKIEVGGGVRTLNDAQKLIETGVDHVIVGSAIVTDPELPEKWNKELQGPVIAGIDADKGIVKVSGWQKTSSLTDLQLSAKLSQQPIHGIIYTSISRDGTLSGPDLHRSINVAKASGKPVILSGGIGSTEDVDSIASFQDSGIAGLIIGKAWYEGKVRLKPLFEKYNQDKNARW